ARRVRRVGIAGGVRAGGRGTEWTGPRRRAWLGAARRLALREERGGGQHVLHDQLRGALDRADLGVVAAQPVRLRGYASVERLCETLRLDAVRRSTEHVVARRDESPSVPLAHSARRFRGRRSGGRTPLESRDLGERASALGGAA